MTDSFQRYLAAKRTVDDRALDRRVLDELSETLAERATAQSGPLTVLDVGAGIGTMLARFLEWDILPPGTIRYTAVDLEAENVDALVPHLREWASDRDCSIPATNPLTLDTGGRRVEVRTTVDDATEYATEHRGEYDLLVGAALLDVFDLDGLGALLSALADGGMYYFPIVFDGATRFLPPHPADRTIEGHYHDHMDQKSGGDSRAGDAVLYRLQMLSGTTLRAVAGSDWVVRPVDGSYPADEAYFLSFILDTVEQAVGEMPDSDPETLARWLRARREQLDRADLSYTTHQLDFLGHVADSTALGRNR